MPGSPAFGQADLTNCERELIHLAGSVQPHGVLLSVSQADMCIVQASSNCQALLGLPTGQLLGQPLEVLEEARLLLHGEALDRLAARCRHPFFSFMDSDIFAVGDFAGSLAAQLPGIDAFFSGRPAGWATDG